MAAPEPDRVLADLDEAIAAAPPEDVPALVISLAARLAALGANLTLNAPQLQERVEQNLSVKEGAARLGVSTRFVYRNAKTLPFTRRIGRRLVVNELALIKYMRRA
jgi:hypothetical protein